MYLSKSYGQPAGAILVQYESPIVAYESEAQEFLARLKEIEEQVKEIVIQEASVHRFATGFYVKASLWTEADAIDELPKTIDDPPGHLSLHEPTPTPKAPKEDKPVWPWVVGIGGGVVLAAGIVTAIVVSK
jgi:hypothetical protein